MDMKKKITQTILTKNIYIKIFKQINSMNKVYYLTPHMVKGEN